MGFRLRRSINLGGGFRINLSKTGIGYSWGVPGYRVTKTARGTTRTTYSIPGTGISWVQETGGNSNRRSNNENGGNPPAGGSLKNSAYSLENASIDSLQTAEICNITSAIERTLLFNKLSTAMIFCTVLAICAVPLVILPILGIILKILVYKYGPVQLEYALDSEKQDEYYRRLGAWQILAEGDKEWQVTGEYSVSNTRTNAGAQTNINRAVCEIKLTTPFFIKTNVDTIQIKLHKEILLFLPDKVFIVRGGKVHVINYETININVSQTNFIESESVPRDAVVIGSTWLYVNKNGTPDRRYKNNRQLPVCQYGTVQLTSPSGLNFRMMFSNVNKSQDFEQLIK